MQLLKIMPDITGRDVVAVVDILDSPLAREDGSIKKGKRGYCCDTDDCDGVYFVDFGGGAIACAPNEIRLAT